HVREPATLGLKKSHCMRATGCTGVGRGSMCRTRATDTVVPLCDSLAGGNAEKQSTNRINVVIFEIDTLQPGIAPSQFFRLHKCFEQPFLRDPIDPAYQRLMILVECFKDEAPAFQQPVRFRAAAAQMFLCELKEFTLHIKRADALAILEPDNPLLSRIARDIARALDGIGQDKISRQTPILQQRQNTSSRADL